MRQYLSEEPDLAPFSEMILHKNAEHLLGLTSEKPSAREGDGKMIVRIAEIEVHPKHLAEYLAYGREVASESVRKEPGVLCIFPMQSKEDSTQVRILEIYASTEAYQRHLSTAHFLRYKQGTLHMVRSLKLLDMRPLDLESMQLLFNKLH
jgi:quinol monooxygenase YgiN